VPHVEAVREVIANYVMHLRDKYNRPQDDTTGRQRRAGSSGGTVSVTISIGVAERQADHRNPEAVLKSADQALYNAKGAGRNCVVVHGQQSRRGAVRTA